MSLRPLTRVLFGLLALAWFAAAPALAAQLPPQKPAPQPPVKKAKKIWTNDDLEALRESANVSTGSAESAAAPAGASAVAEAGEKAAAQKEEDPAEKLRKRLTPLRAELDSVEAQLRSLRGARTSGGTTGQGISMIKAPGGMTTDEQIKLLEQRRADLLRQIADIEEEARRMGVSPGSIR